MLTPDYNKFTQNNISFITYNYDRSLEQFFFTSLFRSYEGISEQDCLNIIKEINIIHLHGSLGNLEWQNSKDYKSYDPAFKPQHLKKYASNINIVSDDLDENPEFEIARKIINNGSEIHFLGFGFQEVNLKRLKLTDLSITHKIAGTAFEIKSAEIQAISSYTNSFLNDRNLFNMKVLDYLREHVVLI